MPLCPFGCFTCNRTLLCAVTASEDSNFCYETPNKEILIFHSLQKYS